MLFDEFGAILLIRFVVPTRGGGEFVFWGLPGGEIDEGAERAGTVIGWCKQLKTADPSTSPSTRFTRSGSGRDDTSCVADFRLRKLKRSRTPTNCELQWGVVVLLESRPKLRNRRRG